MSGDAMVLDLDGHEVRVTSPDKVFFPATGQTKLDLVEYYRSVEAPLLRAMGGRPVMLERYPDGAGKKSFFQKRVPKGALHCNTDRKISSFPSNRQWNLRRMVPLVRKQDLHRQNVLLATGAWQRRHCPLRLRAPA